MRARAATSAVGRWCFQPSFLNICQESIWTWVSYGQFLWCWASHSCDLCVWVTVEEVFGWLSGGRWWVFSVQFSLFSIFKSCLQPSVYVCRWVWRRQGDKACSGDGHYRHHVASVTFSNEIKLHIYFHHVSCWLLPLKLVVREGSSFIDLKFNILKPWSRKCWKHFVYKT